MSNKIFADKITIEAMQKATAEVKTNLKTDFNFYA